MLRGARVQGSEDRTSEISLYVGGGGGLDDLLDGDVVLCGGGAAVFVLGSCVEGFVVACSEFDADGAVGGFDGEVGAVETGAALGVDANAEGTGFGEEQVFEGGGCGFVAEDGEEGSEAALLHDDGGLHDVEGAEGEGSFGDIGEDLGGEVVEGGFEDGDGFALG